ncbi:MAG: phospholipase D-like domain-containing protein [Gammaproteobacteria bacterium]
MLSFTHLLQIAGVLVLLASLGAAGHALLNKRDPRSALGWVAIILFSPVLGMGAYLIFGINRIRRRAQRIREERGRFDEQSSFIPGSIDSLKRGFTSGNHVECLLEGSATLGAVSRLVRNAESSIFLSVYIFESKGVGEWLITELGEAVTRGVDVRVLLDGVGALYSWGGTRKKLEAVGVKVGVFLKPRLIPPAWHINIRNHRKLLVADQREAIVGGTNVRNAYVPKPGRKEAEAKDVNFTISGPVVADIVLVFADDWLTATAETLTPLDLSASASSLQVANAECRVTVDGPDNDIDLLSLIYQAAISGANRKVRIVTPYFLPPPELIAALQVASIRGVTVEIILPRVSNLPFVHWATRNMLLQLLRYGVNVYYQNGAFDHSKLFVVDESYGLVGSANVDARSLILNFEIGVEVQSQIVVEKLNEYVDGCVTRSELLKASELESRSLAIKLRDAACWLLTPYL